MVSSSTPLPTETTTLSPVPILQSTQTSTVTPTIYPTQVYDVLFSPDGTKKIQSYTYVGKTFDILDASGAVLWSITYDDNKFGSGNTAATLVDAGYSPFYWSKDGRYIYLTSYHRQEIDGSSKFYGNDFIDGCSVSRFDIETGEMMDILPEIAPGYGYYAFSISPDEKHLVYTYQNETPVQIKLLEISTKEEHVLLTANEDVLETGGFGWSPKGDQLAFQTLKIDNDEKRYYSIYILDLKNLTTRLLVKDFDTQIRFMSWDEKGVISYAAHPGRYNWYLTLESWRFLPVTMTPFITFSLSSTPNP